MSLGHAELVSTLKLISTRGVLWVCDAECTLIIQNDTGQVTRLSGAASVIWDWLNLGYSFENTVRMLALMQSVSENQAEQNLLAFLADWQSSRLIFVMRSEVPYG